MPEAIQESFVTTTQDQDQTTMAKPKQPRRELKPKSTKEVTVDQSNEAPDFQVEEPKKTQQVGRGKRGKKADQGSPQKPQDAPGASKGKKKGNLPAKPKDSSQGILEALSPDEQVEREQREYEVHQDLDATFRTANNLMVIREKRLYRSTHATYEEYVEDVFQMSSRRARQLTHAASFVKALEVQGVTDLPVNESQARALIVEGVKPQDAQKVMGKAKEDAKKAGKKEPSRADIQQAAKKLGASTNSGKLTKEQKKVQKAVEKGTIPPSSEVVSTSVDDGIDDAVDAAKVADIDLPDADWLKQFPIRDQLNEYCRTLFDEEALFYRWFSPHRKPLVRDVTSKLAAHVRQVAKRVGPYVTRIEKALSLADPRTWVVCRSCQGTGQVETVGACTDCKSAGYRLG